MQAFQLLSMPELQTLAITVRNIVDNLIGDVVETDRHQICHSGIVHGPQSPGTQAQPMARYGIVGAQHIVEDGHAPERARDLICPPDAQSGDLVRILPAQLMTVDLDPSTVGNQLPAQHIDKRCLAGAVGADDSADLTLRNRQINVVERNEFTKRLA